MRPETPRGRFDRVIELGRSLRSASVDLLSQEFSYSTGHLTAVLSGCLFAPSLLTFWFVNGLLDFSTAVAIGAVATPAGLQVRLLAYVLLVPTFLLARAAIHLLHPVHRSQVLDGSCPNTRLLSLDWVSMGILATGLPLALQNFGPWFGMNAVFAFGVFVLPRALPDRRAGGIRLAALVAGALVFLYANYGGAVAALPHPSTVLGPVATFSLGDAATERLFRLANSVAFGPPVVGLFGIAMNHLLTRPELGEIPVVRHTLPRRDPDAVVVASAAFGTAFYLLVVAVVTGDLVVLP
ncbi:hypothetical protein DV707_09910 [Halobellus limi]|uniref:Uncharacterized protein n=1 Tax=Halobellus limi TaxID=699433 RepID=A0A1H5ZU96_9EURY|nr:hypothetical protein DV707_09910 [Halobellus limi]SEG39544.1 hypothetical protein SAMN04488133_2171 [Halobellus limi]